MEQGCEGENLDLALEAVDMIRFDDANSHRIRHNFYKSFQKDMGYISFYFHPRRQEILNKIEEAKKLNDNTSLAKLSEGIKRSYVWSLSSSSDWMQVELLEELPLNFIKQLIGKFSQPSPPADEDFT